MNWLVRYYKGQRFMAMHRIMNRTEQEAEKEAMADMPPSCDDWTLTEIL